MNAFTFIVSFLFIVAQASAQFVYNDQKQNCTKPLLAGSYCYNGPKMDISNRLYKSCAVPGVVALTFDDGPGPYTEIVLDTLKMYNMKATFFLLGRNMLTYPAIIQRIINEGHQVAGHTQDHDVLVNISATDVEKTMLGWEKSLTTFPLYGAIDGKISNYMRPPKGVVDDVSYPVIRNMGYTPVHWSMLAGDSYGITPAEIFSAVYTHFYDGSLVDMTKLSTIIQLHDTEVNISLAMPQIAKYLNSTFASKGVRFVTLADCLGLGIPAYRDNPRPVLPDPTCINGISQTSNSYRVCCDINCGICGGNNCSLRPGGSSKCCATNIITSNITCNQTTAPCIVS